PAPQVAKEEPRKNEPKEEEPEKNGLKEEPKRKPLSPFDVLPDILGQGNKILKSIDDIGQAMAAMTPEEEKATGRKEHEIILRNHRTYRNPAQLDRVRRLAEPLLDKRNRKDIEYTFTLIDHRGVNAFSHVGGYLYVHKGLLDFCGQDDAQLQYVLGHEIAH